MCDLSQVHNPLSFLFFFYQSSNHTCIDVKDTCIETMRTANHRGVSSGASEPHASSSPRTASKEAGGQTARCKGTHHLHKQAYPPPVAAPRIEGRRRQRWSYLPPRPKPAARPLPQLDISSVHPSPSAESTRAPDSDRARDRR